MAKGCWDTFETTYDGILIQFSVFANYGHDQSYHGTWVFGLRNSQWAYWVDLLHELSLTVQMSIIPCKTFQRGLDNRHLSSRAGDEVELIMQRKKLLEYPNFFFSGTRVLFRPEVI